MVTLHSTREFVAWGGVARAGAGVGDDKYLLSCLESGEWRWRRDWTDVVLISRHSLP